MKRSTVIVLSTILYISCYGQEYSKRWENLYYADDSLEYRILDIYLPDVERPHYQAVVVINGSAWFGTNLKGTDIKTLGKALLEILNLYGFNT